MALRVIVILLVIAVLLIVGRSVWRAVAQWRSGAVSPDDLYDVPMEPDRGWQVTRRLLGDVVTVRVEHPSEGVQREWRIDWRKPGAAAHMEQVLELAGEMTWRLSRDR